MQAQTLRIEAGMHQVQEYIDNKYRDLREIQHQEQELRQTVNQLEVQCANLRPPNLQPSQPVPHNLLTVDTLATQLDQGLGFQEYSPVSNITMETYRPDDVTMATAYSSAPNVGYYIISAPVEKIKKVEKCETKAMLRTTFPRKSDIKTFVEKLFNNAFHKNPCYPFTHQNKIRISVLDKTQLYELAEKLLDIRD